MKSVTVWDYANISTEKYLSLSHDDKEKIIRQYYFDKKTRNGGTIEPVYCFVCKISQVWTKLS